jgi:glycosyltransferase involved in cell wall biosynthesis
MNPPCSWEQEISVVFPLVDGRMGGLESVRSWTKRQTLPRDRFQVIAVSDGSDSEYEKRVADLLAPHDRLIRHSTDNFLELYDVGLRHATGRLIVLTEHYCVADPDCLSAVAEYFRENDSDGACLHIDWVCLNEVARLKWNERNQERLSYFDADEHWNKFLFAGFAAYRETFRAIGGLEFRYGLFLEVSVGAQFHDHGIRLGSIPNARVQHLDDNTFK